MLKAGLIFGGVALLLSLAILAFNPLCAPCLAVLLGLGAGYQAGRYERPLDSQRSLGRGALAGAIAGVHLIVGQLIAGALNALMAGASGGTVLTRLFGLSPGDSGSIWVLQLLVACCLGLLDLGLMAGAGAVGGALWFRRHRGAASVGGDEPIPPGL